MAGRRLKGGTHNKYNVFGACLLGNYIGKGGNRTAIYLYHNHGAIFTSHFSFVFGVFFYTSYEDFASRETVMFFFFFF